MNKFIYDGDEYIKEINGVKYKLKFFIDEDATSPREECPVSKMYCFSSRYNLGDSHDYNSIADVLDDLYCQAYPNLSGQEANAFCSLRDGETFKERDMRIIDALKDFAVIKYIYMYSHSGITISTSSFNDPWDSGIVGLVVLTKEDTFEELCNDENTWRESADRCIESEIKEYDTYLRGEVFGFNILKLEECPCCHHVSEEVEDSVCGFYGYDLETNGMLDYLPDEFVKLLKEEK